MLAGIMKEVYLGDTLLPIHNFQSSYPHIQNVQSSISLSASTGGGESSYEVTKNQRKCFVCKEPVKGHTGPYGRNKCKNGSVNSTFLESTPTPVTRSSYVTPPGSPLTHEDADDFLTPPPPPKSPEEVCVTPPPPYYETDSDEFDLFGDHLLPSPPHHSTTNLSDIGHISNHAETLNNAERNDRPEQPIKKRKAAHKDKRKPKKFKGASYFGALMQNVFARSDLIEPLVTRPKKTSKPPASGHQISSPISGSLEDQSSSLIESRMEETTRSHSRTMLGLVTTPAEGTINTPSLLMREECWVNPDAVSAQQEVGDILAEDNSNSNISYVALAQTLNVPTDQIETIPGNNSPPKSKPKRPRKKCGEESCPNCQIEENCKSCESCQNPGLKLKCVLRRCPRLNKRFLKKSEETIIVTKVIDELINNVFNRVSISPPNDHSDDVELGNSKPNNSSSTWTCPICSVQIKHRTNVQRHQSICPSVKTVKEVKPKQNTKTVFKCDHCEAQFSLQKSLIAHMKKNHMEQYCLKNKEILFYCSQCDFKCTAEKYLKAHHKKFHMPKGQFKCEVCGNCYANKDSLRVHMKHSHLIAKTSVVCEFCGCVIVSSSEQDQTHKCYVNNQSALNYQTTGPHFDLNSPYQVSSLHGSQVYNNNNSLVFAPYSQTFQDTNNSSHQFGSGFYREPWQFHQVGVSGWQHSQFGTAGTDWDWHQSKARIDGNWQHSRAVADGDRQYTQAVTDGDAQLSRTVTDGNWQHSQAVTDRGNCQLSQAKADEDWQQTQASTNGQHYQARTGWDCQDFQVKPRNEEFEAQVDRQQWQHYRDESSNSSNRGDITEIDGRNFINL